MKPKAKTIYLDSHATTPVDKDVLSAMLPFFTEHYGNGNHRAGWETAAAMEKARGQVANLLLARPTEIIFTSGATEAINIGLLGLTNSNQSKRKHIITQRTEHSAVLQCIETLQQKGHRVTILNVDAFGRIDLDELEQTITKETLVVAIMLANNEIGTTQPVRAIGEICRRYGAKFFCDLTQGIGWNTIDVDEMNIDLASMSSHKIYGPRGAGALFVRRNPKINIDPIMYGGGQERGLRPGTSNIPGIVGFGKACELQQIDTAKTWDKIRHMRNRLQHIIFSKISGVTLNGCPDDRHPGNLNMTFKNINGEDLIGALPNIIFSTSSACTSGSTKPSHVIAALSKNGRKLEGALRFGLNKYNTIAEIDFVGNQIVEVARKIMREATYDNYA